MHKHQRQDPAGWQTTRQRGKGNHRPNPQLAGSAPKRPRRDGDDTKQQLLCRWKESLSEDFPRRHERAYLVPPVQFFRVSYEVLKIAGQTVNVPTPTTQQSDVREKEAHLRVMQALFMLFQKHQQPLFVILGLVFDNYLNYSGAYENPRKDPDDNVDGPSQSNCFPEAGVYRSDYAIFPRPRDLHTELQRGTFDILIISRTQGLVICEIKAIGDFFGVPSANMTKNDEKNVVRKRLAKALTQLEKEKKVLQYLISDIGEFRSDKVPIMKTLILPNLKRETLEDVLRDDNELTKKFCQCLDAGTMKEALNRCLFAHNFPPVGKAWEVDEAMINSLEQWWRAITGKTGKRQMDDEAYDSLAARFCGPATSLHVQTAHQSRADVRTLPGAVIETARCLDAPTLYPEQVDFIQTNTKLAFLTGPPGTGKTEMLELKAMRWIEEGHVVYVISLWHGSEAVSQRIYKRIQDKLALKAVSTDEAKLAAAKQVKLLSHKEGLKTLLEELQTSSHQATSEKGATPNGVQHPFVHKNEKKSLHLVIDEAPWFFGQVFQLLRSQASKSVELYIWAASVYYGSRPNSFEEMRLVRPLRCPPAVLRELETGPAYSTRAMYPYATMDTGILSSVPPPTDGPPVKRIIHAGPGHTAGDVWECVECGKLVANFLKEDLGIGKCDSTLRPQRTLQYSDVIVSGYIRLAQEKPQPTANRKDADDDPMQSGTTSDHEEAMDTNTTPASFTGFLEGLEVEKVPFDVITTMDQTVAEELASPKNNVVQVAAPDSIIGLERPVVVLIGTNDMNATVPQYVDPWCDVIARCLSQLVIVSGPDSAVEDWVGMKNLKLD